MILFAFLFVPKTYSTNTELLYLVMTGSILCTEYIGSIHMQVK